MKIDTKNSPFQDPTFERLKDRNTYVCPNCGKEYTPKEMKALFNRFKKNKEKIIKQLHELFAKTMEENLRKADEHFIKEADEYYSKRK